MAEGFRDLINAWEDFHVEAEEYRELDRERVLVLAHLSGRAKTSGLDLGQMGTRHAGVFHVRAGAVTRIVVYFDGERALADIGYAPEGGPPGS